MSSTPGHMLAAYAALIGIWLVPSQVLVPVSVNLIFTSALLIYIGSFTSLKMRDKTAPGVEVDAISSKDAMQFPLYGSAALCSLYCAYKYLDKDMVNLIMSVYFAVVGAFALAGTFEPIVALALTSPTEYGKKFKLPLVGACGAVGGRAVVARRGACEGLPALEPTEPLARRPAPGPRGQRAPCAASTQRRRRLRFSAVLPPSAHPSPSQATSTPRSPCRTSPPSWACPGSRTSTSRPSTSS